MNASLLFGESFCIVPADDEDVDDGNVALFCIFCVTIVADVTLLLLWFSTSTTLFLCAVVSLLDSRMSPIDLL